MQGSTLNKVVDVMRPYWFPGKGRLLRAVTPDRGVVSARVFGCEMTLDLSDQIQRNIYLGAFEPRETAQALEYLKPGMIFVDVGANVGYFTALAASRVGKEGKIFAIEPSLYAYRHLEEMVRRNQMDDVGIFQWGVGAQAGELTLYVPPESNGNHAPTMVAYPEGVPERIRVRTLDECVAEWGLNEIDLLKIDIEGYEEEAFKGAGEILAQGKIKALLCEFNDFWLRKMGTSPESLYARLKRSGFAASEEPRFHAGGVVNLFLTLR